MTADTLISIIINNYNYGRFVSDAVESSLQQTYPHVEVIAVDDGSTDESREILRQYGNKIQLLLKENGGQASCFNEGFNIAQGEIIIFLDADDYLDKDGCRKIAAAFDDANISKVHWRLSKVDLDKKPKGQTLPDNALAHGNLVEQLIAFGPAQCGGPPNSPPTSGNAWSRNFLNAVLPMPEKEFRGGADKYLFVLAPLYGQIKIIDEVLGYYRLHGGNNTAKSNYILSYFNRFEKCCLSLSEHLARKGIYVDPATWPRNHWYHKVYAAMEIVKNTIEEGSSFILIDDNHWVTDSDFYNRTRIPFTEKGGMYSGPPADERNAVAELEKQRFAGASFVVFAWTCFWYLTYYHALRIHLESQWQTVHKDDLVIIYVIKRQGNDK